MLIVVFLQGGEEPIHNRPIFFMYAEYIRRFLFLLLVRSPFRAIFNVFSFGSRYYRYITSLVKDDPIFINFHFRALFRWRVCCLTMYDFAAVQETFFFFRSRSIRARRVRYFFRIFRIFNKSNNVTNGSVICGTNTFRGLYSSGQYVRIIVRYFMTFDTRFFRISSLQDYQQKDCLVRYIGNFR